MVYMRTNDVSTSTAGQMTLRLIYCQRPQYDYIEPSLYVKRVLKYS